MAVGVRWTLIGTGLITGLARSRPLLLTLDRNLDERWRALTTHLSPVTYAVGRRSAKCSLPFVSILVSSMNVEPQIRWSDVWLLTAIYQSSREVPASLTDVIAAADFINRSVPNPEELESGLFRLRKALLVTEIGGSLRFMCTAAALERIEAVAKVTRSAYDLWKELERKLDAVPWSPGEPLPHPENTHRYPGFSAKVYEETVQQYLRRMRSR